MERRVPKDCMNHDTTLPKRLGKFTSRFFVFRNLMKWLDLSCLALALAGFTEKVGMSIALRLSALLT
jgi:hypothetical protein